MSRKCIYKFISKQQSDWYRVPEKQKKFSWWAECSRKDNISFIHNVMTYELYPPTTYKNINDVIDTIIQLDVIVGLGI